MNLCQYFEWVKFAFGSENVGRVSGSCRRAVMAAGVLEVIIIFRGGMVSLASAESAGSAWRGSFVEESMS